MDIEQALELADRYSRRKGGKRLLYIAEASSTRTQQMMQLDMADALGVLAAEVRLGKNDLRICQNGVNELVNELKVVRSGAEPLRTLKLALELRIVKLNEQARATLGADPIPTGAQQESVRFVYGRIVELQMLAGHLDIELKLPEEVSPPPAEYKAGHYL